MSIICRDIITVIEQLAPPSLAEQWDNCGLLIGSKEQVINKILLCLDVTDDVVDEAVHLGAEMIVSHHPLIFGNLKALNTDEPTGNLIAKLIKANIVVYAAHTNLDAAIGGVNDALTSLLDLQEVSILDEKHTKVFYKLAVYVPVAHVERVCSAMAEKGAGHIGRYSHCMFRTQGVGTFLPLEGTNPFIGRQGHLEYVDEYKLETIVPEPLLTTVLQAMLAVHPYEEVAYDIYRLENQGPTAGIGRVGNLKQRCKLDDFAAKIKNILGADQIKYAGPAGKAIAKVAVCGGSGAYLIDKAVQIGADVLVTGDIKYHEAQKAVAGGIAIIDAGHFATEKPCLDVLKRHFENASVRHDWKVEVSVTTANKDIFRYV